MKGRLALNNFPEGVRKGIELHRLIDEAVDKHPAVARAKLIFRPVYGLYSGAIVDTVMDHFLANDPRYFPSDGALRSFTASVYNKVDGQEQWFPQGFAAYYPYMKQHDWLFNYRNLRGLEKSLHGLARRAKYMPPPDDAYRSFVVSYYQLNGCYYDFIDDIVTFARKHLQK